jgi:phosphoenolpyruvate synthase/pyruvate phosphate dikinase
MNILWLDEASCDNPTLVGGKVAKLSRLASEYRVPPGFCLTTIAFEQWLPDVEVNETLSFPSALPTALYAELVAAYHSLAERCGVAEPAVAVRSSTEASLRCKARGCIPARPVLYCSVPLPPPRLPT